MQKYKTAVKIAAFAAVGVAASGSGALAQTTKEEPKQAAVLATSQAAISPETQQAFHTLETVPYFAIGNVGRGGANLSAGEKALRVLFQQKNPDHLLRGLLKTANPAGKLYALLGIKEVAPANDFQKIALGFAKNKLLVETFSGCCGDHETMAAVTARIEKGYYKGWMKNPVN